MCFGTGASGRGQLHLTVVGCQSLYPSCLSKSHSLKSTVKFPKQKKKKLSSKTDCSCQLAELRGVNARSHDTVCGSGTLGVRRLWHGRGESKLGIVFLKHDEVTMCEWCPGHLVKRHFAAFRWVPAACLSLCSIPCISRFLRVPCTSSGTGKNNSTSHSSSRQLVLLCSCGRFTLCPHLRKLVSTLAAGPGPGAGDCRHLCPDLVAQTKSLLDFCSVSSAEVITFIPCIHLICLSKMSKSLLFCMPYTTSWNLSLVLDPWLFAWQFLQGLSIPMTRSIKHLSLDNKESFNDI